MLAGFLQLLSGFADTCAPKTFLGLPSWYEYLYKAQKIKNVTVGAANGTTVHLCDYTGSFISNGTINFSDLGLIGLAILDIALRLAGVVAVGYIVYGSIQYIVSQGEPDKTKRALGTIMNAAIGLAIAIVGAATVSFIGTSLG